MLGLILPIWMLAVAIGGLGRIFAPRRFLKGGIAPEELPQRINRMRMKGAMRFGFGAAMVWLMGFAMSISPAKVDATSDDHVERMVREKCDAFLERGDTAGLAVAMIAGNKEAVFTFGRAALGSAKAVDAETLFEIGSITKVFTGIALAKAIEEGRWKLDDKAAALCPDGFALNEAAKDVTLRHLTTHTSGYARMPGAPNFLHVANFLAFGGDPYRGLSLEKFRRMMAGAEPETTPGEKMEYSNFGVSLLGWLLAKKSGTDYETFIRREVLEPLGMASTSIALSSEREKTFAQGYRKVVRLGPVVYSLRSAEWLLPDHLAAAGGLRSNASDMLKFLRANMRLDDSAIGRALRRSHAELFKANDTRGVGMNWIRSRRDKDRPAMIWHNGGTGGFRSFMGFYEDGSAGVVVLSNAVGDTDDLGVELLKALAAVK